jgi:hypothetical protein
MTGDAMVQLTEASAPVCRDEAATAPFATFKSPRAANAKSQRIR